MPVDIREHPDAPGPEELGDLVVDPVPREEIERSRESGLVLVEDTLRERDDLDIRIELNDEPGTAYEEDIGTVLYRYTQLFGAPQLPEYLAGEDLRDRDDETFKFLLRVRADEADRVDDLPGEWLITVYDWHVDLGASVARWREEPGEFTADVPVALTTLALVHNLANEPVTCEYEDIWY